MIEVTIKVFPATGETVEQTLSIIRIENTMEGDPLVGSYRAEIAVDHGSSVAKYTRMISGFHRNKYNVLGLVKLVLDQLTEEEMDLDGPPADMARRQHRSSAALQSLLGKLHRH